MKFEWETLTDESTPHFNTHRAKVFGGWIVRTDEFWRDDLFGCQSEALVFVPDPKHLWVISDEPDPLLIDIEDFEVNGHYFVTRTVRSLKADGIKTMDELLSWCEHELRKIPNFGMKCFRDTTDILRMGNLSLGSRPAVKFEHGYSQCLSCRNKEHHVTR